MSAPEPSPPKGTTGPSEEVEAPRPSCLVRSVAALLVVVVGAALVAYWWWPRASEERVREAVVSTIQREAPASFYVTGSVELTVASRVKNTKILLPGVLDLNMGATESTVRVPGRVYYGFDARTLRTEDIRVGEGGVVEVVLPPLRVQSAEPDLEQMQVQTEAGWARLYDESRQEVERQAIGRVQEVLRAQGEQHLRDTRQPEINTAEALRTLLTPPLQAAGVAHPRFRFRMDTGLVLEPEGEE